MILLEFFGDLIKWVFYHTTRPIIWIITARDCRHCKYGGWNLHSRWFKDPFGWHCERNYHPDKVACLRTPWRCKFVRRGKEN